MAGNSETVEIGAAWAYFGTVAGNIGEVVDLGYTKGGITVTMETGTYEILVDQEGESPIGESITGRRCSVTVPMAETDLTRLAKIIPDCTFVNGVLRIKSGIGDDLMDYADELKIVPKDDPSSWVKIFKASPVVNIQSVFLPNAERMWPMQFKGYIPESTHSESGNLIGFYMAS